MNIKILFLLTALAGLLSCSKAKEEHDDPTAPVLALYKAASTGDSAGVINSFASTPRELLLSSDTTKNYYSFKTGWKAMQAVIDTTTLRVSQDKDYPNMAKVYFSMTFSGKVSRTVDSVYLTVFKEEGSWKVGSMDLQRDKKR